MPVRQHASVELLVRKQPLSDQEWHEIVRETVNDIHSNLSYLAQTPLRLLDVPYGRREVRLDEFEQLKLVCKPGFEEIHNLDMRGMFGLIEVQLLGDPEMRVARYWGLARHYSWVGIELQYQAMAKTAPAFLRISGTSLKSLCSQQGVADKICRTIFGLVKVWEEGTYRRHRAAKKLLETLELRENLLGEIRSLCES
jgi:hypothetical protein